MTDFSLANLIKVTLGASLGASLRYFATLYLPFPILVVNVLGSLVIGFLFFYLQKNFSDSSQFWIIGCLGSFTTFSSFSLNVIRYFEEGDFIKSVGYIVVSVVLCLLACYLGYKFGEANVI